MEPAISVSSSERQYDCFVCGTVFLRECNLKEHIESIRRQHKTENDLRRAQGRLQEDEEPILLPDMERAFQSEVEIMSEESLSRDEER